MKFSLLFRATGNQHSSWLSLKTLAAFAGFDDAILDLYSRGLSTREIKAHLEEIYGVEVSPDLISSTTEAVSDLVCE